MPEPVLRILSYLPNARVWKAQIAGDLCGVEVEVVGARPDELGTWLWDYDARELPETERGEDSPHARTGRRGFRREAHPGREGSPPRERSRAGEPPPQPW